MAVEISIKRSAKGWPTTMEPMVELAVRSALAAHESHPWLVSPQVRVGVRLSNDKEVRRFNKKYRGKESTTNVLAFSMLEGDAPPAPLESVELGDLLISFEEVTREAETHGYSLEERLIQLAVHGTLHLLGYDHDINDEERLRQEEQERRILRGLSCPDPYE